MVTIAYFSSHAPPLRSRLLLGTHLHVSSSLTDHGGDDDSQSEMARYSRWILDGGTSLVFHPLMGILLLNMRPITAAISVTRFTTANPHESVGIHIFLVSYLSKRAFVLVSPNVAVVIMLSLPFAQVSGPKSLSKPSPMDFMSYLRAPCKYHHHFRSHRIPQSSFHKQRISVLVALEPCGHE